MKKLVNFYTKIFKTIFKAIKKIVKRVHLFVTLFRVAPKIGAEMKKKCENCKAISLEELDSFGDEDVPEEENSENSDMSSLIEDCPNQFTVESILTR